MAATWLHGFTEGHVAPWRSLGAKAASLPGQAWRRCDVAMAGGTGVAGGNWPSRASWVGKWGLFAGCWSCLAWSCSTTKYGVELIQYILILKWGITRVSLLVLHGSDTKETKYGIWLILYKLGRSWILICTWIKYYCTNKNNVLSISAFHRQAWKLFECQRWVNYYCLTNNNKWWFNPWIDLGQWRNKCGPYIYRSVRIVAGTDHHWNHLFFGYCPLFWDKDMWDKWFGENKKMRWWFFLSPQSILLLLKTNIPTNWDEEQNLHLSGDHWIEAGCILPNSEEPNYPHGDLQKAVGPRKIFHMSIVHSHSNELYSIPLGGNTSCWGRLSHTETWICGWGHIHHLHPRWSTVISCNISCPNRRNVWSRRQNGDAASAVSRNSLEAQGSPGNFTPKWQIWFQKTGNSTKDGVSVQKEELNQDGWLKNKVSRKGNSSKFIR